MNDRGQVVGNYVDNSFAVHGWLATPGGSDAVVGASSETVKHTSLASMARTSGTDNKVSSDSLGQTSVSVTVPSPPQGVVDPGVTVNGLRAPGSRLVFGLKTY
jgi:hypothetical protein